MKNRNSLRNTLTTQFLLAAILPVFMVILALFAFLSGGIRNEILDRNRSVLQAIKQEIVLLTEIPESQLFFLMELYKTNEAAFDFLFSSNALTQNSSFLRNAVLLDPDGRILKISGQSNSPFIGFDQSAQNFFSMASETPYWSSILVNFIGEENTLPISLKLPNDWVIVLLMDVNILENVFNQNWLEEGASTLLDERGVPLAHPDLEVFNQQINFNSFSGFEDLSVHRPGHLLIEGKRQIAFIENIEKNNWQILLYQEENTAFQSLYRIQAITVLALLPSILLAIPMALYNLRKLITPLEELAEVTKIISKGSYDVKLPIPNFTEGQNLSENFDKMRKSIQKRELGLKNLNENLESLVNKRTEDLSNTIEELKKTQSQLILAEKMAALGNLVAGIAHEINTPIGVGITAVSHLLTSSKKINKAFEDEEMTKSMLKDYLEIVEEAGNITLTNLGRAAELIRSFKMVAVDQTLNELREINLAQYAHETFTSLKPKIKNRPIEIVISCPETIMAYQYPGGISQIITNLFVNSISHGFPKEDSRGVIKLSIEVKDQQVYMIYEDDGIGMDENIMTKVFDPFFTTARAKGGTGLGMHIVYNIVINQLQGSISIESSVGLGVRFQIIFPQYLQEEGKD
jgi:signal transduction histidine kinase